MFRAALLAGLLILGACAAPGTSSSPTPSPAAPADRGIGGTGSPRLADRDLGGTGIGASALADRGLGGTGIGTARVADRGIGGTGISDSTLIADRGIGGTGIVGTVTGFGSVLVNGLRIALPESVAVTEDGRPAEIGDLARGQVLAIAAAHEGGLLAARAIRIEHLAVGPVRHEGALRVAGRRVVTDADTVGAPTAVGTAVAVSGFHRYDGAILATRIAPVVGTTGWSVVGVARVAGRLVTIGDTTYALDGPPPPDGTRIRLAGSVPGRATDWAAAPSLPFSADVGQFSVESLADADGVPEAARRLGVASPATYPPGARVILEVVLPDDRGGADRGPPPGAPPPGGPPPDGPPPGGAQPAGTPAAGHDRPGGGRGGSGNEGHNGRSDLTDPPSDPPSAGTPDGGGA